jgi:hypothetical protein
MEVSKIRRTKLQRLKPWSLFSSINTKRTLQPKQKDKHQHVAFKKCATS